VAGLNDELDEELRLAAEERLADGVDIRNYLPPEQPAEAPVPADRLFMVRDSEHVDEKPLTTQDVLGENLDPEQVVLKEVEFTFLDQTDELIGAFEEIKENIIDNNGTSQNDIVALTSVYPKYLGEGDNVNFYTKSPTKTMHAQTVAKVESLIVQHRTLKKEFIDNAIRDTLINSDKLNKLIYDIYTDAVEDRQIELRRYSEGLKQKDFDKYYTNMQCLQNIYDSNLALVILVNMLIDGFALTVDNLSSLTNPVYVATHLQEPRFTVCSLVNFIGSDYEKKFFTESLPGFISSINEEIEVLSNQDQPEGTLELLKKSQQKLLGTHKILSDMQRLYSEVVHLVQTAGSKR
jgi:hypothetical protein